MRRGSKIVVGVALIGVICLIGFSKGAIFYSNDWQKETRSQLDKTAKEMKKEAKNFRSSLKKTWKETSEDIKEEWIHID
ncbi:hypothetical protein ACYSNR_16890 [Enterococcus sp. LJL128]|uniref:hypothetical protein n=1 Tax=Enterococcus sp. LJL51 TaxID=3416656 RepID=UPI003CF98435